jgi:hypothetical protein
MSDQPTNRAAVADRIFVGIAQGVLAAERSTA